jgi:hypothetical protein
MTSYKLLVKEEELTMSNFDFGGGVSLNPFNFNIINTEEKQLPTPQGFVIPEEEINRRLEKVQISDEEIELERQIIKKYLQGKFPNLFQDGMLIDLISSTSAIALSYFRREFDEFIMNYHQGKIDEMDDDYVDFLCEIYGLEQFKSGTKTITLFLITPLESNISIFYPEQFEFTYLGPPTLNFILKNKFVSFSDDSKPFAFGNKKLFRLEMELKETEIEESILIPAGSVISLLERFQSSSDFIVGTEIKLPVPLFTKRERLKLLFELDKFPYDKAATQAEIIKLLSKRFPNFLITSKTGEETSFIVKPISVETKAEIFPVLKKRIKLRNQNCIVEKVVIAMQNDELIKADFEIKGDEIRLITEDFPNYALVIFKDLSDINQISHVINELIPNSKIELAIPIFIEFEIKPLEELTEENKKMISGKLAHLVNTCGINKLIYPSQVYKIIDAEYCKIRLYKDDEVKEFLPEQLTEMRSWIGEINYGLHFKKVEFV